MSTPNEDTKSTADDAENSVESTTSEQGILISRDDLDELSKLLETFRDAILAHEARLGILETVVAAAVQASAPVATDTVPEQPKLHVVGNTSDKPENPAKDTEDSPEGS